MLSGVQFFLVAVGTAILLAGVWIVSIREGRKEEEKPIALPRSEYGDALMTDEPESDSGEDSDVAEEPGTLRLSPLAQANDEANLTCSIFCSGMDPTWSYDRPRRRLTRFRHPAFRPPRPLSNRHPSFLPLPRRREHSSPTRRADSLGWGRRYRHRGPPRPAPQVDQPRASTRVLSQRWAVCRGRKTAGVRDYE